MTLRPVVVVHRRVHRADHLARRVLAMHARHWLERDVRGVRRSGVIAVDAQPVHDAAVEHLVLADDRHVVLGLAGGDTGLAADAGIQIDRHRPGVARVFVWRIKRRVVFFALEEMRVLPVVGERALADQIAPGDAVMPLRRGQPQRVAGLGNARRLGRAMGRPRRAICRRRNRHRRRARPQPVQSRAAG